MSLSTSSRPITTFVGKDKVVHAQHSTTVFRLHWQRCANYFSYKIWFLQHSLNFVIIYLSELLTFYQCSSTLKL